VKETVVAESTGTWSRLRRTRSNHASVEFEETPVAPPEAATPPRTGTFIGADVLFEGSLKLRGDFRIDTEFRGLLSTDGKIIVGPHGSVEGDIVAHQVEIEGAVVGNVEARRMFVLRATGRLHGDVQTACIQIEPHGFYQGNTRMVQPVVEAPNPSAPVETA